MDILLFFLSPFFMSRKINTASHWTVPVIEVGVMKKYIFEWASPQNSNVLIIIILIMLIGIELLFVKNKYSIKSVIFNSSGKLPGWLSLCGE